MPNLAALDRLHRIEDQRHRILGTYSPLRSRIEVVPREVIEQRIAENELMIAHLERDLGLSPGGSGTDGEVAGS
jgi:hypothetical protein